MSETIRTSHLGICATDLDRSLRFWVDGMGFERAERYELDTRLVPHLHEALEVPAPVSLVSQFIRRDGMAIELLAYDEPAPTGRPSSSRREVGITHLAFHVDELDPAVAHLEAHGGRVVAGTAVDVGTRVVFLEDPDGVRVELMERPSR